MDGQNFCIEMYRNGCFSKASIRFHPKKKKSFVGTTQSLRPENEKKEAKLPPLSQVWGEWRGENPLEGYKSSCLLLKFLSAKTLDLFVPGDIFLGGGDSTMWCITESSILRHLGAYACSAFFSKCKDSKTIQVSKPGFPSIIYLDLPPIQQRQKV